MERFKKAAVCYYIDRHIIEGPASFTPSAPKSKLGGNDRKLRKLNSKLNLHLPPIYQFINKELAANSNIVFWLSIISCKFTFRRTWNLQRHAFIVASTIKSWDSVSSIIVYGSFFIELLNYIWQ